MKLSACIEDRYMFGEAGVMTNRIRAAKAAGLELVEFHLWQQLDMKEIERTLNECGMQLTSLVIGPRCGCVDKKKEAFFLDAMRNTIAMIKRLHARAIVVAGGPALPGATDAEQHASMVYLLKRAAPLAEQAGVSLWLEPLNSRIDHPGMFMNTAREGLDIIEEVGSPAVRLLYDVYHSTVMGESWEDVLPRANLIGYVQVADTEGRHEPGSGNINWTAFMSALKAAGYRGDIGMEYRPTGDSAASVAQTRRVLGLS
jgi:hydroxypyruvate isomerase